MKPGTHIHWTDAENCPELGPEHPVLLKQGPGRPFTGYRDFDGMFYKYGSDGLPCRIMVTRYCPIPDDVPPESAHPGLGDGK